MNRISWGRVVVAGLVAGLLLFVAEGVINGAVLGAEWHRVTEAFAISVEHTVGGLLMYVLISLVKGVALAAAYAVARETLGGGWRTALAVGAGLWLVSSVLPWATLYPMGLPRRLVLLAPLLGVVGTLAAALVAQRVYEARAAAGAVR
jgi:hypothetical protein